MVADALPLQLRVDLGEGALADHARAARRQLPRVALAPDVALALEDLEQLAQLVDRLGSLVAEQLAQVFEVDTVDVAVVLGALQLALQAVDVLHLRHQLHRGVEADLLVAPEGVGGGAFAAGVEVLEVGREL